MKSRRLFCLTLIICFSLMILSCGRQAKQEEIKIGAILPLTGEGASYGKDCQNGMVLAIEQLNQEGGIAGKKLIVIFEDSKAEPKTATNAINKLVNIDRVPLVIGDMFSSPTLAMAPIAQSSKVVLLSPTSSAEEVPESGDYIFTIYPSGAYEGNVIAEYAVKKLGYRQMGALYINEQVFDSMTRSFKNAVESAGGQVVFSESFPAKTVDFRTLISKYRNATIDALFVTAYRDEIGQLIKQAREMKWEPKFLSQSSIYDEKALQSYPGVLEGIVFTAPYYNEANKDAKIDAFRQKFSEKYGTTPNVWAAYGYDAVQISVRALLLSQKNKVPLQQAMFQVGTYPGLTGDTTFNPNGSVRKSMTLFEVKQNKFAQIED